MPAVQLTTRRVEKPWGRRDLWAGFDNVAVDGDPIGEVWFQEEGADPELLVKYLFTSEKLSIQDHPDDATARARGYKRGKDEAWVILDAEPHATIGLGMIRTMTQDELRASALDGTIEQLIDWKSVKTGDFFYSPAGTVHAIGPGLTMIEVQQNVDLTYRLYDYDRGRELNLDEGISVAVPVPYVATFKPVEQAPGRLILADGPAFVLERWSMAGAARLVPEDGRPLLLIPLAGEATIDGAALSPGTVWSVPEAAAIDLGEDADLVVAYRGGGVVEGLRPTT